MSTELIKKMKEQIALAREYGFPYVNLTFPLDLAEKLVEEHEVVVWEPGERVYDL